jgi:hypothetical protein
LRDNNPGRIKRYSVSIEGLHGSDDPAADQYFHAWPYLEILSFVPDTGNAQWRITWGFANTAESAFDPIELMLYYRLQYGNTAIPPDELGTPAYRYIKDPPINFDAFNLLEIEIDSPQPGQHVVNFKLNGNVEATETASWTWTFEPRVNWLNRIGFRGTGFRANVDESGRIQKFRLDYEEM